MGTIEKGAVTQTQALPSLTTQQHHPLPPDPNRIVGKKRFFLLITSCKVSFLSVVLNFKSASIANE